MNRSHHIAWLFGGTAVWLALSWLVTTRMGDDLSWYHMPFLLPVITAIVVGGVHSPNAIAGNAAWILQSLAVGALLAWVAARRRIRKKAKQDTKANDPGRGSSLT
jgi:hypothetical protein